MMFDCDNCPELDELNNTVCSMAEVIVNLRRQLKACQEWMGLSDDQFNDFLKQLTE